MEVSGRITSRLILFSLLILVIPMVLFPNLFGTSLLRGSLVFVLYELAIYGTIVFLFHRHARLVSLIQAAGLCLVYRLVMGALFGVLIAAMYAMDLSVSITLGVSSYVPALVLHIGATPFILKPLIDEIIPPPRRVTVPPPESAAAVTQPMTPPGAAPTAPATSARPGTAADTVPVTPRKMVQYHDEPLAKETTGFDRATRYIGEDASVHLAAVVDHEGLLLSRFVRAGIDPEDWAPLALLLSETNGTVVSRMGLGEPERVNLTVDETQVVVVKESGCRLLVVSERRADDVLGVRINQAREIIRKYVEERYTDMQVRRAEISHV